MATNTVSRMRYVVSHWSEDVIDEARALERGLAEAAADALVDAMMLTEDMTEALEHGTLTPAEEQMRAVQTMEGEVGTGGFMQFFDNCGASEVELAAEGCARIGAKRFETIVREALAAVPVVPDEDWPQPLLDALGALDERFYDAYEDVEGLLKRRIAYAAEHPEEFRGLA